MPQRAQCRRSRLRDQTCGRVRCLPGNGWVGVAHENRDFAEQRTGVECLDHAKAEQPRLDILVTQQLACPLESLARQAGRQRRELVVAARPRDA